MSTSGSALPWKIRRSSSAGGEAAIRAVIEQAPPEHRARLRQLQFRIDLERRRAKTPLGATVRLQSMMWERFAALRAALLDADG